VYHGRGKQPQLLRRNCPHLISSNSSSLQAFANFTVRAPDPTNPSCLSRGETKQTTDEATTAYLDLCHGNATTEYTQHRRCVEQTIHAVMHEGIGPTMWLLSTSPNDPVFFMHHGFVDWQWKRWQDAVPSRSVTSKCLTL
jgi:tyrosinase